MRLLFILVCISIGPVCPAQNTGFFPGAIITKDNQRIEGEVKNLSSSALLVNVRFRASGEKKAKTYTVNDLLAYEIQDNRFVPKITREGGPARKIFVMEIIKGDSLSLYGEIVENAPMQTTGGMTTMYGPHYLFSYCLQRNGETFLHPVQTLTGFRKDLTEYLKYAPKLCADIRTKTLTYKDIEEIVKLYNEEVRPHPVPKGSDDW